MADTPSAAEARYEAFVRNVAESGNLWALSNSEGWANWSDDEGSVFPVWDALEKAQACSEKTFPGYQPEQLSLDLFLDEILPMLREREIFVGVNLTAEMGGVSSSCEELERVLGAADA
jgi:hypothetical protein